MGNILVFGASTTYGCWDPEGGWVTRLRKFIDQNNIEHHVLDSKFTLIYNLGIPDDTSQWILERFEVEVKNRLWEKVENVIIFEIGKNDSLFNNKTSSLRTPPELFKQNLQQLVNLAQKYAQKIIFISSLPADDRVDPIPWAPDSSYKNQYLEQYNNIVKLICEEEGVGFVEIYQKVKNSDYRDLLEDGIHPNSKGHERIFETVKDYLVENEII